MSLCALLLLAGACSNDVAGAGPATTAQQDTGGAVEADAGGESSSAPEGFCAYSACSSKCSDYDCEQGCRSNVSIEAVAAVERFDQCFSDCSLNDDGDVFRACIDENCAELYAAWSACPEIVEPPEPLDCSGTLACVTECHRQYMNGNLFSECSGCDDETNPTCGCTEERTLPGCVRRCEAETLPEDRPVYAPLSSCLDDNYCLTYGTEEEFDQCVQLCDVALQACLERS